jgi:hypothetical protein
MNLATNQHAFASKPRITDDAKMCCTNCNGSTNRSMKLLFLTWDIFWMWDIFIIYDYELRVTSTIWINIKYIYHTYVIYIIYMLWPKLILSVIIHNWLFSGIYYWFWPGFDHNKLIMTGNENNWLFRAAITDDGQRINEVNIHNS